MNNEQLIYLDSYTLQSDLRIRVPKSAIVNLNAIPGKTKFSFYLDRTNRSIVISMCDIKSEVKEND